MGSFSRAIKKLLSLKRGKKEKPVDSSPPKPSAKDDAPPRLPAIESSSPLTTERPLSPSHPLASRQIQAPRDTVSVNIVSGTSPSAPAQTSNTLRASQQGGQRDVSPGGLSSGGTRLSIAVSGISDSKRSESSPTVHGVADALVAAVPKVAASAAIPFESTTTTTTATHTAAAVDEHINSAATADKEVRASKIHSDVTEPPSHTNGHTVSPESTFTAFDEGKIAVLQEPPLSPGNIRTTPGMSATSGPLEDFPEGGGF